MADITITNDSKNNITITNEKKSAQQGSKWSEHSESWAETGPGGTKWANPGTPITNDSKKNITIMNDSKN